MGPGRCLAGKGWPCKQEDAVGLGRRSAGKGWPCRHEDLSLGLQLPHKKSVQKHVFIIPMLGR